MLQELGVTLSNLDPIEFQASCHLPMTGEFELDREFLKAAYNYRDDSILEDSFQDMVDYFDDCYARVAPFLCDEWDIFENKLSLPEDCSQSVAIYYAAVNHFNYDVIIAKWRQPTPHTDLAVEMISARFEPEVSSLPVLQLIYCDERPIISCKYHDTSMTGLPDEDWSGFGELSPEDAMRVEQLLKVIPRRTFDTTP